MPTLGAARVGAPVRFVAPLALWFVIVHYSIHAMIKYIGSKRTLVPAIMSIVADSLDLNDRPTVLDLFSGTSRVGHALKSAGYRVVANDHNAYAHALAVCYVQADRETVFPDAERMIGELNGLPGSAGYFTETFCVSSRFLHPSNGERVDAMRERIARWSVEPELEAVLLVSLMEAADRVDSTTGVQMAYLKSWASRASNQIELRVPDVLPRAASGKGRALMLDAEAAVAIERVDLVYIDPPYNQHSYLGNYHVWESLVRWDKPEVYGTACKRIDCRERKSDFNSRVRIADAMSRLIDAVRASTLIVSFSDDGFLNRGEIEAMLGRRGSVTTISRAYKRYVGAKIGIHNHLGERVGRVGRVENTEFLFVVSIDEARMASETGCIGAD